MAFTFDKIIDRMQWAQTTPAPGNTVAGMGIASDVRPRDWRVPFVYELTSATASQRFNTVTKAFSSFVSFGLGGTFGAGATMTFVPSFTAVGTIAAGATTTSITLNTALPNAVNANSLANRGVSGENGYRIRIIDTTAGKIAERSITGNSAGANPTITVDSSFGFVPATGAKYELASGRLFALSAGTTGANVFKYVEASTGSQSASLSTTGLPATIGTDSSFLALDEQFVPYDCYPGEGMIKGSYTYDTGLNALTATATGASSITGAASGDDAGVAENEYRNFQIRIVEDTTTPGAVGQRRIIASHTAGPSAVYTLGTAWSTQPSATAKFVIELPNILMLRTSGQTTVYTYNYTDATINNGSNSIASAAWSTTYIGAAPAANASAGMWMPSWGIRPEAGKFARQSICYFWRGQTNVLDALDIAGGTAGSWASGIGYDTPLSILTASTGCYAPRGNQGRYFYLNIFQTGVINQMYRFDVQNRLLTPFTSTDWLQSGTAGTGQRMASYSAVVGTKEYDVVFLHSFAQTITQELVAFA